ncbi:unnamed protein product [Amoebophrya sp. A25]|nr:unnamed protein product [Amoebophrya sp. A25]|eukprot:GSA25T00007683001.1
MKRWLRVRPDVKISEGAAFPFRERTLSGDDNPECMLGLDFPALRFSARLETTNTGHASGTALVFPSATLKNTLIVPILFHYETLAFRLQVSSLRRPAEHAHPIDPSTHYMFKQDQAILHAFHSAYNSQTMTSPSLREALLPQSEEDVTPYPRRVLLRTRCASDAAHERHPIVTAAGLGLALTSRTRKGSSSKVVDESDGHSSLPTSTPTFVTLQWDAVVQPDCSYHRDEVMQFLVALLGSSENVGTTGCGDERRSKVFILTGLGNCTETVSSAQQADKFERLDQSSFEELFSASQLLDDVDDLITSSRRGHENSSTTPSRSHQHQGTTTTEDEDKMNHEQIEQTWMLPLRAACAASKSNKNGMNEKASAKARIPWKKHISGDAWQKYQRRQHEEGVLQQLGCYIIGLCPRGARVASAWRKFFEAPQKSRGTTPTSALALKREGLKSESPLQRVQCGLVDLGTVNAEDLFSVLKTKRSSEQAVEKPLVDESQSTESKNKTHGNSEQPVETSDTTIEQRQKFFRKALLGCVEPESRPPSSNVFVTKGLSAQRKAIADAVLWPRFFPSQFEAVGLDAIPAPILVSGPSGSGKTHLAQWLSSWLNYLEGVQRGTVETGDANSALPAQSKKFIDQQPYFRLRLINPSEIVSPYVGESEANLRRVFEGRPFASTGDHGGAMASVRPVGEVIVFENVDQWLIADEEHDSAASVYNRLLTTFLVLLDGVSPALSPGVVGGGGDDSPEQRIVVCTTSQPPENFPSAILRPGRLRTIPVITEVHRPTPQ